MEIAGQVFSIFGMLFNVLSYQQKSKKGVIVFQLFGTLLFSVSFFLLGAYVGAMLNALAMVRSVIFINGDRLHANHIAWLLGFSALYVGSYFLAFTVFAKPVTPFNLIIELLPVIGMIVSTMGYRSKDAKTVRRYSLVTSGTWLIYDIFSRSVGGTICEVISIVSIIVGMLRLDRKKKDVEKTES